MSDYIIQNGSLTSSNELMHYAKGESKKDHKYIRKEVHDGKTVYYYENNTRAGTMVGSVLGRRARIKGKQAADEASTAINTKKAAGYGAQIFKDARKDYYSTSGFVKGAKIAKKVMQARPRSKKKLKSISDQNVTFGKMTATELMARLGSNIAKNATAKRKQLFQKFIGKG